MGKKRFEQSDNSFGVIADGELLTHAVVGSPSVFYVYIRGNWKPWSKWIRGDLDLFHKLKKLQRDRALDEFVELIEITWNGNQK